MLKIKDLSDLELLQNNLYLDTNEILMAFGISKATLGKWKKELNFPKSKPYPSNNRTLWLTKTSEIIKWYKKNK